MTPSRGRRPARLTPGVRVLGAPRNRGWWAAPAGGGLALVRGYRWAHVRARVAGPNQFGYRAL